ncbi:MAG: hypothetical protein APF81_08505 [Desulfosporosinus sp. BRH_c37]|nr:MAG: hypothetical protein APF81_08505 [Desulfosporosinus sp. BRH_c37]
MIKIIQGTYGHRVGTRILPKTKADGSFETTAEKEQRLVERGVAVYVGIQQEPPDMTKDQEPSKDPADIDTSSGSGDLDGLPEYNGDMKLDELKEIAKAYGVDASNARKKVDIIEMIEVTKGTFDDQNPGEEGPPVLDAASLVVE